MIDLFGLLYDVAKDIKAYLEWDEEEKLVDFDWPQKSGLAARAEADDMTLTWCWPDKIGLRQLDGYEIVYEVDKVKHVRRKLILRDGLVLIGKRGNIQS